jgi:hypothetical protein
MPYARAKNYQAGFKNRYFVDEYWLKSTYNIQ